MAVASVDNFVAAIANHNGIAKTERFWVQLFPPSELTMSGINNLAQDLVYQCDGAELPGLDLTTSNYRTIGPVRTIASMTNYHDVTLNFYCTGDFYEKPFFESWVSYINPRSLGWDFRYKSEYTGTVQICQLDLTGDNIKYCATLINAYPTVISPMTLNWQDDSIHRLAVTFKYDRYDPTNTYQGLFANVLNMQPNLGLGLNMPNPLNTSTPQGSVTIEGITVTPP